MARVMAVLSEKGSPAVKVRRCYVDLLKARLGDIVIAESVREAVLTAPDADILLWHTNLRSVLGLADVIKRASGAGTLPQLSFAGVALTMLAGDAVRLEVSGTSKQMLTLQLFTLVRTVGPERLDRCDCGKLFVRVGKRRSCSERCQKRTYMRRYRAGDAGGEE